jgi:hypothetical protein
MTDIDMPAAMEKAANFIEVPGNFGKGSFKRDDCYCTLGAYALSLGITFTNDLMNHASGSPEGYAFDQGWTALSDVAGRLRGRNISVQGMNDLPETTAEQMANVLRETAKRLRGKPSDA